MRSLGLAIILCLAACKIDSTVYQPPADDDDDDGDAAIDDSNPDAPPQGISIIVNPGTTTVSEGGQVTVRIKLSEAPPVDRPITVIGTALLVPTPSSVTFTPSNWMNERTIILAAGQDPDADDSPVTVLFDGMGDVADGSAMVMITDDDDQVLVVSPPSSIGVTEGASGNVSVQLAAQPSSNVVVSVASMDTAIATTSTGSLTFTNSNWNTPQTVMVMGTQDANTSNDATLLILDPAVEGIPTHTLAINITDDDILAIDASPANLGTLVEGGAGVTFGVRLTQMPPANVVVSLDASPSGSVNVTQTTLTFTPGNYATVQNVTASAPQDPNVVDEQVSIRLSAVGLADRFVAATNDDNDTQVLQVTPNPSLGVNEGSSNNFSVSLAFDPGGTVIVDVGSADTSIASVDTSQLTFSSADYNQPQTVNVSGVEDVDLANEVTQVSFNAAAQGLTANRTVNVTDDDQQVLNVSPTDVFVAEGGTDSYEVSLSYQPTASVTVMNTVAGGSTTDISAAPGTLTFTPANYSTPQTVTVTGLQDGDAINETATVTVSSSGLQPVQVTAHVSDDDSIGINVSPAMMTVTEGGASMNLMVSLAAMPSGNVIVSANDMPGGYITMVPNTLTFTTANYATPQAISVTAVQDQDGTDDSTTIHLTASGLDEKTVPVFITDDDTVVPVLTPSPVTIEEGKSGSVELTLSRDPGRSVTVEVLGFGNTDFEVQPTFFFFEAGRWNVPQNVDLFAYPDDETDDETEDVLFAIQEEGTQTSLRVNIDDPTILLGFPPPNGGNAAGLNGLEAWRDGQMPQCFLVEKIAVEVVAVPSQFSALQVGLYDHGSVTSQPDQLLYSSGYLGLGMTGGGLRVFDVQDTTIYNFSGPVTTWVAVEATTGVSLKTKSASGTHCSRTHMFGNFLPDPFNASGSGQQGGDIMDGGVSSGDAGTVTVTCNQTPPVAVWVIGRDAQCFNPAKPQVAPGSSALLEGLIDTARR